jgi:hypothetical protein
VAFKSPNYHPRAEFLESDSIKWKSFVGGMIDESKGFEWALDLGGQVELDLFDASFTDQAITELQGIWEKGRTSGADDEPASLYGSFRSIGRTICFATRIKLIRTHFGTDSQWGCTVPKIGGPLSWDL